MIDIVGEPQRISGALKKLMNSKLKTQVVKVAVQDAAGVAKIETLDALKAASDMIEGGRA